mgnify:CR=1 FL=1
MDIINLAREIGKEIQKDERYLKMRIALQSANEDADLQDLIGRYNLQRLSLQDELRKPDRDEDKVKSFQQELNGLYDSVMKHPKMAAYNEASRDFNLLMRRVNAILSQSAEGMDPETADYSESACGGDCASCAGCH